jgi:hypothetical protein
MNTVDFDKKINEFLYEEKEIMYEPVRGRKGGLSVKKNERYDSYTFTGPMSKSIAKLFMENKTKYKILTQIQNKKGFRQFIPFRSWPEMLQLYSHEGYDNRYLNEIILSHNPCKPYLDIEWLETDAEKKDHTVFLRELRTDLIEIFKKRYGYDITDKNILISSAHSEKKVSFHIVINCIIDKKYIVYKTNRAEQESSAHDLYLALLEKKVDYKSKIDNTVYTTDREMRALYSTKFGQLRSFVPLGWRHSRGKKFCDDMLDYFITYFASDHDFVYLKTPLHVNLKQNHIKATHINQIKGNHLLDRNREQVIIRLRELLQHLHPTAYYTGPTSGLGLGFRFSYEDKNELCYTGYKHKNNGFYIYIKQATGHVNMYCHSSKCQRLFRLGLIHRDTDWNIDAIRIKEQFLNYKDFDEPIDNEADFLVGKLDENTKFNKFVKRLVLFGGTYCIKSPMGTGKTQFLKTLIETHFKDRRILYLSHRQTFTQNIAGNFSALGFYNYMDGVKDLEQKDRLIVQIDSLKHLMTNSEIICYDMIILDECESILNHLSSVTIGENRTPICTLLSYLIKEAKTVLALDADLDERSYHFLKEIREKPRVLINEYKGTTKRFLLSTNYDKRKFQISEDIKAQKNIVIICLSKTTLDDIYEHIIKNHKDCKVIRYSSMTDDSQKQRLKDVNTYWKTFQVVMYSPTIEAGVDFNEKGHFQRMYAFFCNGSCSPRSFLQMVGRIRSLDDNNIRCQYDRHMSFSDRNIYVPTLDEIEELIIGNTNKIFNFEMIKENKKIIIKKKNVFTKVFAYNKLEEYLKDIKFIGILKELITIKGDIYIDDDVGGAEEEVKDDEEIQSKKDSGTLSEYIEEPLIDIPKTLDQSTVVTQKNIYEIDDLLKAPDLTEAEIKKLEKKQMKINNNRVEKICLKRYWMIKTFKITPEEFDKKFLDEWYNKEYVLSNALYAMNKKPLKNIEDVYFNKIEKRLEHLKQLLDIFGFKNIFDFDTVVKKDDELEKKMKNSKMIEYNNYKKIMNDFNKKIRIEDSEDKFALNKFIMLADSILYDFGIRLESIKKQIRIGHKRPYIFEYKLIEDKQNIKSIVDRY